MNSRKAIGLMLLWTLLASVTDTDQQRWEQQFLDIPSASETMNTSKIIDAQAHYPGTPGDHAIAQFMRDKLAEFGFDARIEPFYSEVYTPKRLVLQLMTKPTVDFDLREGGVDGDDAASRPDAGIPFNAFSASANVTAPLVYAGRGLDADYTTLAGAHVDVRGKIVLVRYGAEFRGLLARRAADRGATGVLFYNDPIDENRGTGQPYPNGPFRPSGSVQRGSLGYPPVKIPALPISAQVAAQLIGALHGIAAPDTMRGALAVPYVLGMTPAGVHLNVQLTKSVVTLWNTVGVLPGTDASQSVVFGGHRDAWAYGVTDNGSGIAALLEAARGLGFLYQSGWRPHRSIYVVGFDGEEIGEAGSQTFVAQHKFELQRGCVAYVNADEVTTGPTFGGDAAAALAPLVVGATHVVSDPSHPHESVFDYWHRQSPATHLRSPGGGSDFEPFLYQLGIPTLEVGFFGPFGVYHSAYDDLAYATKIADPGFVNHRTEAQLLGVMAIRLAGSPAIPYQLSAFAPAMNAQLTALEAHYAGAPLGAVHQAIARFELAAARFDARDGARDQARAIDAVRTLDAIFYGRRGYAAVAFPDLTSALDSGSKDAVAAAALRVAAQIDRARDDVR